MAATGAAYGEHKFGQNLTGKLLIVFGVVLAIVLLWATADKPSPASHPGLLWISAAIVVAGVIAWVATSKNVLTINDHGVRRESAFGVQEIPWHRFKRPDIV